MNKVFVFVFFLGCVVFTNINVFAEEPYSNWGPPCRIIFGAYSMEPNDWELWDGVFNMIHEHLIGIDEAKGRSIIANARKYNTKILVTTSEIYDVKSQKVDISPLKRMLDLYGLNEPAIFGYEIGAAN